MGMSQFWYGHVGLVERLWKVSQTHTYGKSPPPARNYYTHYPMHIHVPIQNIETKNDVLIQRISQLLYIKQCAVGFARNT
eukprot:3175051-Amphidinium_carterae.1